VVHVSGEKQTADVGLPLEESNFKYKKFKDHLPWGRSQQNNVWNERVLLYEFASFKYVVENDGCIREIHFFGQNKIIFEFDVTSHDIITNC